LDKINFYWYKKLKPTSEQVSRHQYYLGFKY
jgi:hypothetical protein